MNLKTKKFIAKEGLVLSGFIIAGIFSAGLLLVFGYPLYLLIRFIIWAVKTLKKK